MTYLEKLQKGLFYNCPDDGCVKELYYNETEKKYCVSSYSYSKIIDVHNNTITDDEFRSKLMMYPDDTMEYEYGTDIFSKIQAMLDSDAIIPDCIGMVRHVLYSFANAQLCERKCEHCLHFEQCEAIRMRSDMNQETEIAKDCGLFLDRDAMKSTKTFNILRVYFVNEISKLSNFDQFVAYCNRCGISRELLKSLDINFIVFYMHKGQITTTGHAQVYATREKAEDYLDTLMNHKINEAKRFGGNVVVAKTNASVSIKYGHFLENAEVKIQLASI